MYGLLRIDHVRVDHSFKVQAWRNGMFLWEWDDPSVNRVGSGWESAYFWARFDNLPPGNVEMRFTLQPMSGEEQERTLRVEVDGPAYVYQGEAESCRGPISGGWWTDWYYTCEQPAATFRAGETVQLLVRVRDVWNSHRFRIIAERNGYEAWRWTDTWREVGAWGWQYSHFWPVLWNAEPGAWVFRMDLDAGNGGFEPLDEVHVVVDP